MSKAKQNLEKLSDAEILKRAEQYGYRLGNSLTGYSKLDRQDAITFIMSVEKRKESV
jgi:hypothetical protein